MEKIFETQRLLIRKWRDSDAHDHFEYCSDPEVTKFLRFLTYKTLEDSRAWFEGMRGRYTTFEGGDLSCDVDFAIELKTENKVIGSIGTVGFRSCAGGVIEIGYILNPKYQGNGYMTEAIIGMMRFIKRKKLAMRIQAKHDVENLSSGRVMQRAGMTFEGIHRKADDCNYGKRRDSACYSILWEEIID